MKSNRGYLIFWLILSIVIFVVSCAQQPEENKESAGQIPTQEQIIQEPRIKCPDSVCDDF